MVTRRRLTLSSPKYGISGNVLSTSCRIVFRSSRWANQAFHGLLPSKLNGSHSPRKVLELGPAWVEGSCSLPPEQSAAHRPSGATRYRRRREA